MWLQKAGPIRDVISFGIKNNCVWWSGYDLLRRLLFIVVYLILENFESNYTQVMFVCIIYVNDNDMCCAGILYTFYNISIPFIILIL